MTIKTYTRRDSATAVLRKLGLKPRDYDLFIKSDAVGFHVNAEDVKGYLDNLTNGAPKDFAEAVGATETKPPVVKSVKAKLEKRMAAKTKPAIKKADGAETVSSFSRARILAGDDNETLWKKLVAKFGLDDKKRGYPSWYRNQLRGQGHKV